MALLPLLLATGCGSHRSPSPSAVSLPPPAAPITSPRLVTFHMVTARSGWALALLHRRWLVVRTQDGGRVWANVSPAGLRATLPPGLTSDSVLTTPYQIGTDFLTPGTAWVFVSSSPSPGGTGSVIRGFYTTDGGRSWTRVGVTSPTTPLVSASRLYPTFRNGKQGWLLVDGQAATVQMPTAVFATGNGGLSWHPVALSPGMASTTLGSLSGGGSFPNGITFTGPTTGLMTAQNAGGPTPPLFLSTDGGVSWRFLRLPVPARDRHLYGDTLPPVFFGPGQRTGVLPVAYDGGGIVLYRTTDGGLHWHPSHGVTVPSATGPGAYSFATPRVGWVTAAGTHHLAVYRTRNGGVSWTGSRVPLPWPVPNGWNLSPAQIDFVNPRQGWILAVQACVSCQEATPPRVAWLRTLDGGRTWSTVAVRVGSPR